MVEPVGPKLPSSSASPASSLSSVVLPALLKGPERAVAVGLVTRVVTAEQRRQRWWWFSLAVQVVVAFLLVSGFQPNLGALWWLGLVFIANMVFHFITGVITRARLGIDANREVLDVAALLQAIELVGTGERLGVAEAIDRVDQQRRLRAR